MPMEHCGPLGWLNIPEGGIVPSVDVDGLLTEEDMDWADAEQEAHVAAWDADDREDPAEFDDEPIAGDDL